MYDVDICKKIRNYTGYMFPFTSKLTHGIYYQRLILILYVKVM